MISAVESSLQIVMLRKVVLNAIVEDLPSPTDYIPALSKKIELPMI